MSATAPTRRPDARTGGRSPGAAPLRGQRRAARGAGALYPIGHRSDGRRNDARSAIPSCASTGSRPARCPSPAAPGRSSRRRAATRRPSRSPRSSAATCSSSCARWSTSSAPASRSAPARRRSPIPSSPRRATSSSMAISRWPSWRVISRRRCCANVGDEIADGTLAARRGAGRGRSPCSTPCGSISRCAGCVHYTGTDWRTIQPWILFTNYQRYVDQFVAWALARAAQAGRRLHAAGAAGRRHRAARRRRRRRSTPRSRPRRGIASRCRPTT